MKQCVTCKLTKEKNCFHKHKGLADGLHKQCKICRKEYATRRKDIIASQQRKYKLKSTFGISSKQYDELLKEQNNLCAICNIHQSRLKRAMAVDHCHKTGKVRGLLCSNCNTGIGNLRDSIKLLERAIEYLKKQRVGSYYSFSLSCKLGEFSK